MRASGRGELRDGQSVRSGLTSAFFSRAASADLASPRRPLSLDASAATTVPSMPLSSSVVHSCSFKSSSSASAATNGTMKCGSYVLASSSAADDVRVEANARAQLRQTKVF